jgi:hypothetical protein
MGRVGDVISLVDNGIQTAEGMEYRPLMWRLRKVKAQAQALLRDIAGSTKEYSAAAGVIHELVNAIDDPQLKQVYLSSSSVLSVLESSKIGSNDGSSPSNMLEKDSI